MLLPPVWTWEANPLIHQVDPDGTPVSDSNVAINVLTATIETTGGAGLRFGLTSSPNSPSSAHVLASAGADYGVPRDPRTGQPFLPEAGHIELNIGVEFTFSGELITQGILNSAMASASVKITVEEFSNVNFTGSTGATSGPRHFIGGRPQDIWYFIDRTDTHLSGNSNLIWVKLARAGFAYRIWVDLEGEIRAAGFGEPGQVGGSAASATMGIFFLNIGVTPSVPLGP